MAGLSVMTRELLADTDTPVSALVKLCSGEKQAFLFESGETDEAVGRHSIVAWDPLAALILEADGCTWRRGEVSSRHERDEFFELIRTALDELALEETPDLPFVGGLVGYVGWDAVRLIERLPGEFAKDMPAAQLYFPACFLIFDHLRRVMTAVTLGEDQAACKKRMTMVEKRLGRILVMPHGGQKLTVVPPDRDRYMAAVAKAKEYIYAGDIFQVVLSDEFRLTGQVNPLSVYRWLRVKSPSPYMFYLNLGDIQLVGASPETLVKLEKGRVLIRPIAGTRGRGGDAAADDELEREMMASEKERAEHVMLVDLARNDAGRVSDYGTIQVHPYMTVERYSHVMHIVSQVTGRLGQELDAVDAFKAAFPAGTLSGAPKVRAMEIIEELEPSPRGVYGGGVGCFGPGRRMDTCIGIRMMSFNGDQITVRVGAGIVADSDPAMEYREIEHKAAQSLAALELAANGGQS